MQTQETLCPILSRLRPVWRCITTRHPAMHLMKGALLVKDSNHSILLPCQCRMLKTPRSYRNWTNTPRWASTIKYACYGMLGLFLKQGRLTSFGSDKPLKVRLRAICFYILLRPCLAQLRLMHFHRFHLFSFCNLINLKHQVKPGRSRHGQHSPSSLRIAF